MIDPSGRMTALVPTVEMLTTVRPSSIARIRANGELLNALVGVAEVRVVGLREDHLGSVVAPPRS